MEVSRQTVPMQTGINLQPQVACSYQFSFTHGYIEQNYRYWSVNFYDSLFKEKASFDYYGNDQTASDKVQLPAGGVYYVKITESSYKNGITYGFNITSHTHSYTSEVTKATLTKDGTITRKCSCGYIGEKTTIYRPNSTSLSVNSYTYDGKSHNRG